MFSNCTLLQGSPGQGRQLCGDLGRDLKSANFLSAGPNININFTTDSTHGRQGFAAKVERGGWKEIFV